MSPAFALATPLSRRPTLRAGALRAASPRATYRVSYGAGSRALIFSVRSAPRAVEEAARAAPEPEEAYRLSAGERARTVVHVCASGTLCTSSAKHAGVPFGSHVDYVLDAEGRPVFLLANNATHTKNLGLETRCSLYCQPPSTFGQDGCRATLVGGIAPLPEEEGEMRDLYVERHAHAADALKYPDSFHFYRMDVLDVFYVGGYGVVSQWVDAAEFSEGEPDPLAFDAPEIVASINEGKEEDLKRLCKVFLELEGVTSCTMTSLDRLGFDLRVRDKDSVISEYRVAFREVVQNRFDVQSALVKAFQEAWERENGYDETWVGEDARPTVLYYAPKVPSRK